MKTTDNAPPSATLAMTGSRGKTIRPLSAEQNEWLLSGCVRRPAPHERDLYNPNVGERLAAFEEDIDAADWCASELEVRS